MDGYGTPRRRRVYRRWEKTRKNGYGKEKEMWGFVVPVGSKHTPAEMIPDASIVSPFEWRVLVCRAPRFSL